MYMGIGNYRKAGSPEYRYTLTTRNKQVIDLCERLRKQRGLSKTIETLLAGELK